MGTRTIVSEPPFVSEYGYGKCDCGCGGDAPIATKTEKSRGSVIGYPRRFIAGHQRRKHVPGYKVNETTGCWEWTGRISNTGYAATGSKRQMHREFYKKHKGPIPKGMQVHHTCFVKHCVNPDHLELATPGENTRASAKVLNWEKARKIRKRLERGETATSIAAELTINVGTIRAVGEHKTWREPLCCPECGHEFDPWTYMRRSSNGMPALYK